MPEGADLIARVAEALSNTEPGPLEQALENQLLPGDLPGELRHLVSGPVRQAAVLIPLIDDPLEPRVLFTRRNDQLRHHAGQISFPGGSIEAQDSGPVAAALRETVEETGMDVSDVEVLGFLDTYLTITRFAITPVVARVPPGKDLRADPVEVAELFEVPLAHLLDPANLQRHVGERQGYRVRYYAIPYRERHIWGATAGMLVNLKKKMRKL